jgi:multidrug resistance efflux pump
MSGLDIFAWIVLVVLAASTIGVILIAGALPGQIASSRGHPWAQAVTVAGWVTLFFGFVLWPTLEAQLKFAELRLEQMTELHRRDAGRLFDVQQRQSEVDQLTAQLEGAKWDLEKTVVRAPADGYVTNVALQKGARVASAPVMAFIDTAETIVAMEIAQINARYIEPGQPVELTFKFIPGRIHTGKVEAVLQAISTGQMQPSGLAVTPKEVQAAPFIVRVALDDAELGRQLPAGSTGEAAIFTDRVKVAHVIRQVLLRQIAILNYVNPF